MKFKKKAIHGRCYDCGRPLPSPRRVHKNMNWFCWECCVFSAGPGKTRKVATLGILKNLKNMGFLEYELEEDNE